MLFRSGEKEILHFYLELAEYTADLCGMNFNQARKTLSQLPEYFAQAREYFA